MDWAKLIWTIGAIVVFIFMLIVLAQLCGARGFC